ncbi:cation-translocating P-type ATPase [Amycolatopsis suaedae]|uniref:HAD family hydrolase n=1 Tax=Amycolatopsis suaedae TaxID=2510978 RepID=A0A4Q7JFA8_9PSEU|nr:HAD-IC family P-type ATPase [Amycolatopsis suaedae]RZQ65896.1 HAD family hydrolase [Amycolatopsis suaedae]
MNTVVTSPGAFHAVPADEVVTRLDTDLGAGLSQADAARRLEGYGPNRLRSEQGPGVLRRLFAQVRDPLVAILVVAAAVTAAFGDFVDSGVIAGVVVLNAVIGFVQEARARRALDALARMVPLEATVVRDGVARRVAAEDLVPGDIVDLAAGDRVPADVRLTTAVAAEADESMLTGESLPVTKTTAPLPEDTVLADRVNLAYSGTTLTRGSARGIVVATGSSTQLGAVQGMVEAAGSVVTPLTRKLGRFSRLVGIVILGVAVLTFAVGLVRGTPVLEMFTAAVALAVGAIPEGLPAAVSIVLAIGVVRMSRRNAVVRYLPAVETLGGTTVICTDKTGTLTRNRMTVTTLVGSGAVVPAEPAAAATDAAVRACLRAGVLCNDAEISTVDGERTEVGDPTETALLASAERLGIDPYQVRAAFPRLDVLPFESERRFMATVHRVAGSAPVGYVKGAVEEVLARCTGRMRADGTAGPLDVDEVLSTARSLAGRGLRVLAFARFHPGDGAARQVDDGELTLLGLQAMQDPPRPEAVAAVHACRAAGVEVKMITGDHAATASAIARQVGLVDPGAEVTVLTGADLERLGDEEFAGRVADTSVFARVSPAQKLRLVEALQERGQVVAMTGDGVNDAPALRRADIGVAMGRGGTDAARQAADMVLTDDNFASIESAVEEGRGVFANLRKFLAWTFPANIGEGMVILVAVLAGLTLPIIPVQILWINMTTAVFLGLTMAFEPKEDGIMVRPPRRPDAPLLTADLLRRVVLVSLLLVAAAFTAYEWAVAAGADVDVARTSAINAFVAVQIAYLLSCRSLDTVALRRRAGRNRMVPLGIGLTALLQLALTYLPPANALFHTAPVGWESWGLALAAGAVALVVAEFDKLIWRARRRQG